MPRGISLFGWGTVTRPRFVGCVNCQWLPFVATCVQPSSRSMRINRPLLCSTTYSMLCINIHNAASRSTGHTISLLLGPQTAGVPIDPRRHYGAGRERRHGACDASGRAGDGPPGGELPRPPCVDFERGRAGSPSSESSGR